MNKAISTPIAIIIIVLLAILVGGIIAWQYFGMSKEEEISEEISSKDETADWKTYRNEQYGFEIDYPTKDWIFKELVQNEKSYGFTLCRTKSEDSEKVCIFMMPGTFYSKCYDLGLKKIIEKPYDCMDKFSWGIKFDNEITTNTGVEGIIGKGFHIGYDATAAFFLMPNVLLENNMRLFIFLYYYSGLWNSSEIYPFNEEKQEVFNQMLSTFKFTE